MTYQEAISYIEKKNWGKSRPGLSRIKELMSLLGDPQKSLTCIHIAGSNGKGSLAAILERTLREAGYTTGLFTSPHLICQRERIRINGSMIPEESFAHMTEKLAICADMMEDHPSQFELYTALALMYFAENKIDIAVIEVGMGGELDSTNVIDPPILSVITNIGFDHTEWLGESLSQIASAKAGIIKSGTQTVSYDLPSEAMNVIKERCRKLQVPLNICNFSEIKEISHDLKGQSFSFRGVTYKLALLGRHQLRNAATALLSIDVLRASGLAISDYAVREALSKVTWPARFQLLSSPENIEQVGSTEPFDFPTEPIKENTVILDGGHNPQCARALADAVKTYLPGVKPAFVMGIMKDKDYGKVIDLVAHLASSFFCIKPDDERGLDAGILAEEIRKRGVAAKAFASCREALDAAMGEADVIVCFGSLYLAGEVLSIFDDVRKSHLRKLAVSRRKALTEDERQKRSEKICRLLGSSEAFLKAGTVLFYRAMPGEVCLDPLIRMAVEAGKHPAFPLCTSPGIMEVRSLKYQDPFDPAGWKKGAYGIEEPVLSSSSKVDPKDIDLVCCPLTAFDENANRLGMGGGYYDRFLPKCPDALKVGVAFSVQRAEKIPISSDLHDVSLDAVFTEDEIYPAKKL
jgi:dihydrofolate synthase/folylpolyglutamate synthase